MASVQQITARIVDIACYGVSHELTVEERARLVDVVGRLQGGLYELAEGRRFHPDAPALLPAPAYLGEKLTCLCSFTRIALGAEERGGYSSEKIIENVESYRHAVERLMA